MASKNITELAEDVIHVHPTKSSTTAKACVSS
jgi:hypothetical protein